jgi:hypothetical protein
MNATDIIAKLNDADANEDEAIAIIEAAGWDVDRDFAEDGALWGVRDAEGTLHVLEWSATYGWHEAGEEFLFAPDVDGEPLTEAEAEALCERAEAWLDEHGGAGISWRVQLPGKLVDAVGTYQRRTDGSWQILGYTVAEPAAIRELTDAAWLAACETLEAA